MKRYKYTCFSKNPRMKINCNAVYFDDDVSSMNYPKAINLERQQWWLYILYYMESI